MIDARTKLPPGLTALDFPLTTRTTMRESEARSMPVEPAPPSTAHRTPPRPDVRLRRIATDILGALNSRLPGRIRDLNIRVDEDQFVLSGVATSYHVKQVAQHVAMNALDAVTLGRLVNEIEVRPQR